MPPKRKEVKIDFNQLGQGNTAAIIKQTQAKQAAPSNTGSWNSSQASTPVSVTTPVATTPVQTQPAPAAKGADKGKGKKHDRKGQQDKPVQEIDESKSPFKLDFQIEESKRIFELLQQIIGKEELETMDEPIVNYLVNVIEAQNNPSTRIEEKEVIRLLALFLDETVASKVAAAKLVMEDGSVVEQQSEQVLFGVTDISKVKKSSTHSVHRVEELFTQLKDKNLVKHFDEEEEKWNGGVKVLEEAVNLGKRFQDQLKKQQQMLAKMTSSFSEKQVGDGADMSGVNTNTDIDWKEKVEKMEKEKKMKKQLREERQKMKEYEDYLQRRGLSNAKGVIKMHNKEQVTGPRDIHLTNVSISVGSKELLSNADITLTTGRKYGLIGRNGVGKTTLLRHFVEREIEGIPPYLQILHIEQEVIGDDSTPLDIVLRTDVERERLLTEERELMQKNTEEASARLAEVYARMDEIDAHSADSRAAAILAGLGFTLDMQNKPSNKFSGGWRMRIALARALFVEPDILLLDEPTNHLDLHAVLWLETYLQRYEGTLLVVSHSRSFLNSVTTDIIHFHDRILDVYRGNYNTFEKTRMEQLKNQQKMHEAQEKQRKHIQSFIDRFRYKASTAKMAQSRIKILEKMEYIPATVEDPTFQFEIPSPEAAAPPFIQVVDVTFGYSADKILFKKLNFSIDMDSRIALVGENGAGKSTFLNVLLGDLKPLEGIVNLNRKIRIAKFSQHHMDALNMQQTPLEHMKSKFPQVVEQDLRNHLGKLGVSGNMALQPIYTLSGGQKSRVSFAEITFKKPHILLLDEPSNHLDLDTVDALIEALNMYEGGVLLVSHDEHLIKSVCDEIWVCGGGEIQKFDGTFDEYKKSLTVKTFSV